MLRKLLTRLLNSSRNTAPAAGSEAFAETETEQLIAQGDLAETDGRLSEACDYYRRAVAAAPENAKAHLNLGVALDASGDAEGAIKAYEAALGIEPHNAYASYNLAKVLCLRADLSRSEVLLRTALKYKPEFPEAQVVLANVHEQQGRLSAAAAALESALAQRPDWVGALYNYGLILRKLGRLEYAEGVFARIVSLDATHASALHLLGTLLHARGALQEAETFLRRALDVDPDHIDARLLAGSIRRELNDLAGAEDCFRRVIAFSPDHALAHYMLGFVLFHRNEREAALEAFQRALSLQPDFLLARWARAMAQIPPVYQDTAEIAATRADFHREMSQLQTLVESGPTDAGREIAGVISPFYLAYNEEDNRELLARHGRVCAHLMDGWLHTLAPVSAAQDISDRIHVGIASAHIHDHSVWNAIVKGWVEHLDPHRFRISFYHLGDISDAETDFARARASHFEQGPKSLEQWIRSIHASKPNVLIYPEIGMDPTTLRLASLRLAPVQAASWGHPETTGLPTIDYYFSAECFEPSSAATHYTEALIRLPGLGICYQPPSVQPVIPDMGALGIDENRPILVNPGTPFKYSPRFDWVWVEIARRIDDCQLIFFVVPVYKELSERLRARLQGAFSSAGLEFDRHVRFIPWLTRHEFPGLMQRAHAFLDSIGFSGFNTAIQAVEAGLPIVTREGRFMRGRLASGILNRMDLSDLVAKTEAEYIDLAVKLATDDAYRDEVRARMAEKRAVLYNDLEPVRALEDFLASVSSTAEERVRRF